MKHKSAFSILRFSFHIGILLIFASCNQSIKQPAVLDIEGHRGCRGLVPENTIPAFIKALQLGVTTLEMDVVISKDGKVLLSHEPFLSHEICLTADGKEITEENEKSYNLYTMTYDSIKQCDCGSKPHPRFPHQQKFKIHKPLLTEVIDSVEAYLKTHSLPYVQYNIETKTTVDGDSIFHPSPREFVEKLMTVVKEKNIQNRTIIQSFDIRTLQVLHQMDSSIVTALLVENGLGHNANIRALGFIPTIYSPDYKLVTPLLLQYAKKHNMKVIPWTINTKAEMQEIIEMGVDGIITDYPDSAMQILLQ